MAEVIEIRGAREHNLKNVSLKIPKYKLVVFTGVSGSGKSSLAFDTLYAEGQRRYVESLSSYARQFLGQLDKPKVDHIRGLSPTIAIEQKSTSNNPRSTVGTVTEIYDYLRVLFARFGKQHCPTCGRIASGQTVTQICDAIFEMPAKTKVILLAPLVAHRKGEFSQIFEEAMSLGFTRVRVDGTIVDLAQTTPKLDKKSKHSIEAVIDRILVEPSARERLVDSVEQGLRLGKGLIIASTDDEDKLMSSHRACTKCGISFGDLSPQNFSFNSPVGACVGCKGLGFRAEMDPELIVPDSSKTVADGAILPWAAALDRSEGWKAETVTDILEQLNVPLDVPWKKIPKAVQDAVMWGTRGGKRPWEGLAPQLMRRFLATKSDGQKEYYNRFLSDKPCPDCEGSRLKPESRAVRLGTVSLPDVCKMSITNAHAWMSNITLSKSEREVTIDLLREIEQRLGFLLNVGLEYLTLARNSGTLSGGESQRIRLASQIGSELSGVIYVLDEPSIGLHQRDNERLLGTLLKLRDLGNTVVVVEHDEDTVKAADWIVDFGPGAGIHGGSVIAEGLLPAIKKSPASLTGAYLSGKKKIEIPKVRRTGHGTNLSIFGAEEHNLKKVDVTIPLGTLTVVTGVSGAGKSTLIHRILLPATMRELHDSRGPVGKHAGIDGLGRIDKVVPIDQQPIGRTPRSNPATYTKLFDPIRILFAQTKEARAFGFEPGRFSFNVEGGRCETCFGDGVRRVEMHFLADVFVTCDECKGKRFNEATLRVTFKGKSIADVLELSVSEAQELFSAHREIKRILDTLADVGLGYMKLGQPSPTLSGGEAQRIKLSRELSRIATSQTLYVLDEPTTGLHFEDISKLLGVLNRLVDQGNTVVVIEHNLDVIKCADWVIDLGPEGGDLGGYVIAEGTPEHVADIKKSHTGTWLDKVLKAR